MKKTPKLMILALAVSSISITAFSSTSFAAFAASQEGTVTITDASSSLTPDPTLVMDFSPGVVFSYATNATEFAVAAANENAQVAYRMEYGVYSPITGYYQQPNTSTAATIVLGWVPTTNLVVGSNPFTAWAYMGNTQ